MKILFLVNAIDELKVKMATSLLMTAAARRHQVSVCSVGDFGLVKGQIVVTARTLDLSSESVTAERVTAVLQRLSSETSALSGFDVVMVRTNPGRDHERHASHAIAMHFLREAQDDGMLIVNGVAGLTRAATKAYLARLPPAVVPQMIVSRRAKEIEAWARALDDSFVLKPIAGTRGNDVFVVHPSDWSNVRQMIRVVTRQGYAMAQRYLPEAVTGDTRVLVVSGKILEVGGRAAAVARVPAQGDFRSNIHAGGRAQAGVVTDGMRAVVDRIGPQLVGDGLFIVGLDFIADQIIEVNVFSPGGFGNAMEQQQRDFAMAVIEQLEQWVEAA